MKSAFEKWQGKQRGKCAYKELSSPPVIWLAALRWAEKHPDKIRDEIKKVKARK